MTHPPAYDPLDTVRWMLEEARRELDAEIAVLADGRTKKKSKARRNDDRVRFDGRASVDEIEEAWEDLHLDTLLEDRDEYDTIGGLVFHRIGGVPKPGDVVELEGLTITVESTDGRRVSKVLVVRDLPGGAADDAGDR